jgi:alcohol dehydrogenase (cytochrome c)
MRARNDLRRQALPPDAGRARDGARHENRQGDLEDQVRRVQGRLQGRHRADDRERRARFGHGRRRQHDARFIEGYDPNTGKRLWRTWTIPAPGEKGSETWPNASKPDAWKYGGGATWQMPSYDPQLDLIYIGTGNAEPYNPSYRDGADSLYTASVLALRPKTGEMVWHYQYVPNDSYDYDATAESVLADIRVNGQMRKVLINAHKNGFLYVLDRTNGQLLAANPYVRSTGRRTSDMKTGRPVLTEYSGARDGGETVDVWPLRGTNATLAAFNPKTGFCTSTRGTCSAP